VVDVCKQNKRNTTIEKTQKIVRQGETTSRVTRRKLHVQHRFCTWARKYRLKATHGATPKPLRCYPVF